MVAAAGLKAVWGECFQRCQTTSVQIIVLNVEMSSKAQRSPNCLFGIMKGPARRTLVPKGGVQNALLNRTQPPYVSQDRRSDGVKVNFGSHWFNPVLCNPIHSIVKKEESLMSPTRFVYFVCCLALLVAFATFDANHTYAMSREGALAAHSEIGQGVLSTHAQAGAGVLSLDSGIGSYTIFSADGQRRYLGTLIVVGSHAKSLAALPKGFTAGAEYWYWRQPAQAFPASFFLSPDMAVKVPSEQLTDYAIMPNLAFDLNNPQPFPKLSLDPSARTYTVYVGDVDGKVLDNDADAWFAFWGNGDHLAWAPKDLNSAYLYVDIQESLLFVGTSLPAAESVEVVIAR